MVLKFNHISELLRGFAKMQILGLIHRISDPVGLEKDLRIFVPKKYTGDTSHAALGTSY